MSASPGPVRKHGARVPPNASPPAAAPPPPPPVCPPPRRRLALPGGNFGTVGAAHVPGRHHRRFRGRAVARDSDMPSVAEPESVLSAPSPTALQGVAGRRASKNLFLWDEHARSDFPRHQRLSRSHALSRSSRDTAAGRWPCLHGAAVRVRPFILPPASTRGCHLCSVI